MEHLDVTRMSAKGQVVIPGDIRQAMALKPGTKFVVAGDGDTVILKRIGRPMLAEVDKLFADSRTFAKRTGLKNSDVKKAVQRARSGK
jgi:AbrB family looped-hinge helix DNA binding protein